jgi:hypothetical protein
MQTLEQVWKNMTLQPELKELFEQAPSVTMAFSAEDLRDLAVKDAVNGTHEVAYDIPGKGRYVEANVCRLRNGISANYTETYMRRRDPNCMLIGDKLATDKEGYKDRFGVEFSTVREETFDWLKEQDLAIFAFNAGQEEKGIPALAICPANAGFFALGLAMLQGIHSADEIEPGFEPRAVIYVAPPFRHTHFDGKQIVVHERSEDRHEIFSYNLYPGPSAKKGVYGILINLGEQEGWVTAHCSTVMVVTPYDNYVVIMHEGASGGGKSEMLEQVHREADGRLLLGENVVSKERRYMTLPRSCELRPVADDMALCHGFRAEGREALELSDAEDAWFVRVNHIEHYGTDPHLERMTVEPSKPLLFMNIDAVPDSRALIWEHIEDEPGVPCPNPRVIIPRKAVPGIIHGSVAVDIRSFGVRTPPCTREDPTYGIIGLFHVLPPALAWLWRLTSPRGHANPSIVHAGGGIPSEGVGSYWPFATGRKVDQANLLFRQIMATQDNLFVLTPNQYVGAWHVGFMPQWLMREYLARRGTSRFRDDQLQPARSPLLGYTPTTLHIEGSIIGHWFLQVETQPEVGVEAYDHGAGLLREFFEEQLNKFLSPDLDPLGRKIIESCLDGASIEDYEELSAAGRETVEPPTVAS